MFEQIASDFEHYDRNKLYLQLRMAQLAIIRFGDEMETTEASVTFPFCSHPSY